MELKSLKWIKVDWSITCLSIFELLWAASHQYSDTAIWNLNDFGVLHFGTVQSDLLCDDCIVSRYKPIYTIRPLSIGLI